MSSLAWTGKLPVLQELLFNFYFLDDDRLKKAPDISLLPYPYLRVDRGLIVT
ncbi:MAG: hypothetical protein HC865_17315 [Cyanobacteria bacterium RU_5_0]|nr:hypothetical protein [Cyanobacteria bacterium RU_5_0]